MTSLNEAKEIALKFNPNYDTYYEYKQGYAFLKESEKTEQDCAMVVLKLDGKLISFAEFDFDYLMWQDDVEKVTGVRFK